MAGNEEPRASTLALFVVAAVVLGYGIGRRQLFETSESRYGSLAATMARTGDYVVPRLNGVRRFEKPPFSMWCMATSIRLLGENEFAVRLPGVLFALLGVGAAYRLGAARSRKEGAIAALLTIAAPLYFGLAKGVTTDIYLATLSILTLLLAIEGLEESSNLKLNLAAIAAGLGFLTKGPAIILVAVIPIFIELLFSRRLGEAAKLLHPVRIGLFLATSVPWFVVVCLREPGLLGWFVKHRAVGAVVSAEGFHDGPFFYYLPVFLLGFFPGSIVLLVEGYGSRICSDRRGRLMMAAMVVPLVFFSFSASKLATYVLPALVPVSVLAARLLARGRRRSLAAASLFLLVLVAAMAGAASELAFLGNAVRKVPAEAIRDLEAAGLLAAVLALVALLLLYMKRAGAFVALVTGQVMALMLVLNGVIVSQDLLGGSKGIILKAASIARNGGSIICYKSFLRAIPFYAKQDCYMAFWYHPDELTETEIRRVVIADGKQLRKVLARGPSAVLCHRKWESEVKREVPSLETIADTGHFVLLTNDGRASGFQSKLRTFNRRTFQR